MASAKVTTRRGKRHGSGSKENGHSSRSDFSNDVTDSDDYDGCAGADLKLRYQLSQLELKNTLGTGTFGRVVLARHRPTRQYFALKILTISEVIRLKQVEHVRSEKCILAQVTHPFIVSMLWSHHDERFLYMLLEYVCGGELFSYLRNAGRFSNTAALFYASEITCALEYLHALNIVYRDLKPENLLLDREGHLKLTDFGFAKTLEDRTWTLCGTPEYLAPEIIQSKGHNKAVDWWALGVLIYEMVVGYPPFFDDNPFGIYEKILNGKLEWPKHIDPVAKDLVRKLLVHDRTKRLGNMKSGTDDIKKHKWFRHICWDEVVQRKLKAPVIPYVTHRGDTRNFVRYDSSINKLDMDVNGGVVMYDLTNIRLKKAPIIPIVDHNGDTQNFPEHQGDYDNSNMTNHDLDCSLHPDLPSLLQADITQCGNGRTNHHQCNDQSNKPPVVPTIAGEGDTSNFDEYEEEGWKRAQSVSPDQLKLFVDF